MQDTCRYLAGTAVAAWLMAGPVFFDSPERVPHGMKSITIVARDHAFDTPDTMEAGPTQIRLEGRGKELHHATLVRMEDGMTVKQLTDMLTQDEARTMSKLTFLGGPNAVAPGAASSVIVTLKPGRYAWVCFVPGIDGRPHLAKGMVRAFVVVPAQYETTPPPKPDMALMLNDYEFKLPARVPAGRHIVSVRNYAAQPHELIVFRLLPGRTKQDLLDWFGAMNQPPPAAVMGGVSPMSQGLANLMHIDLASGTYVLVCFVPDAKDHKPHLSHGMIQAFTVN
jgi:hypothetical protein